MVKRVIIAWLLLPLTLPVEAQRSGGPATSPATVPDFTAVAKAANGVADAIEQVARDLPSIESASATAQALDRWSQANEAFTTAAEAVLSEHPNYPKQAPTTGNRELISAMAKIKQVQQEKPILATGMKDLLSYHNDPQVETSFRRFQASLDHLKMVVNSLQAIIRS